MRIKPSIACATFAFALPFFAYLFSLMPSFGFGDIGEMQTVPYIFGIPHPTGFPAFVLFAGAYAHLLQIGNVAWRMNLLSALAVATSAWALFAALLEADVMPVASLSAALIFGFTQAVWFHATRADVHDFVLVFEAIAFLFVMRWRVRGSVRDLVLGCAAVGFALATHPLALWALPGLFVLVLTGTRRLPMRAIPSALGALLAPLLLYLYIPLRSAQVTALRRDPTVVLGLPPGQPFWDYAHTSGGFGNLLWFLSGAQFRPDQAIVALIAPSSVLYSLARGGTFAF
ncbi:MAG: protein O-mannosyl-transferase family, partial [Candidatus Baltobacteraceae bacterium]